MAQASKGKWRHKKLVIAEPMTDKLRVYLQIMKLAEIVFQKHFSFLKSHKQDLISVAVNKAVKMLEKGEFDATKGNMRNYLYAGMRNDCQNYYVKYIKYTKKEISTDDFTLLPSVCPLHDSCYDIDFNLVYSYVKPFERRYGDLREWTHNYLLDIGWFFVHNPPTPSLAPNNPPPSIESKLRTVVMWSVFDTLID